MSASVTLWEATTPVKLPAWHGPQPGLRALVRIKIAPGWYFTADSPRLASQLLRLPPMLHKRNPNPVPNYSKAPRGLFVLLRVHGIFTAFSISPGPSLRQCSSCYTIRAGRNLPDKEFRYLRTVIVTAAVHRGFSSKLRLAPNLSL